LKSFWTLVVFLSLPTLLLLGCSESAAEKKARQADLADKIESLVELPEGAGPIESYGRNYLIEDDGSVQAFYTTFPSSDHAKPGEVQWLESTDDFLYVCDGGCDYITVTYNPKTDYISAACNGEA